MISPILFLTDSIYLLPPKCTVEPLLLLVFPLGTDVPIELCPPLDAAPKLRDGGVEGMRITSERCGAYCLLGRVDSLGVNVRFGTEGLLSGI